jgi:hypothetical protein
MHKFYPKAVFASIVAGAILAACHGGNTFTPSAAPATGDMSYAAPDGLLAGKSVPPEATEALRAKEVTCTAPLARVPGSYVLFIASGNVKHSKFTANVKTSIWEQVRLTKATPPPSASPSPTASPTNGPTPAPEYFYWGTYKLAKGKGGCAVLLTTKNGKPIAGTKANAVAIGTPKIKAKYYHLSFQGEGPMSMTISGLSATGGSGPFTLRTSSGAVYNTGTVTLVGRELIP